MSLLTKQEVAALLAIEPEAVYDLPIPRVRLSARRTRWELADVEEYKNKCRSTSTPIKSASASTSRVALTGDVTELQNSFRKAGAEPKPKRTTGRKAEVYTLKPAG